MSSMSLMMCVYQYQWWSYIGWVCYLWRVPSSYFFTFLQHCVWNIPGYTKSFKFINIFVSLLIRLIHFWKYRKKGICKGTNWKISGAVFRFI